MSTCTALDGYCANCDYWFHESVRIPFVDGELYAAQYMGGPVQLLLQTGDAVRSVPAGEGLRLVGPDAAVLRPLLRLLAAGDVAVG